MKKTLNLFLIGAVLALGAVSATAQDYFAQTRTYVLATNGTLNVIGNNTTTNAPVDVRAFDGKVSIDIFNLTNAANAVLTATIQTSDDKTNWYSIPNYAVATATSVSTTNYWAGYSNVTTQTILVPGVLTYPTAYSAGFATPYLAPALFTNSGAYTVPAGYSKISYPVEDGRQYIRLIWAQSGGSGATNVTCGATVSGLGNFPLW